jgi:hypothetical protein
MKDFQLYQQILGLTEPWRVEQVTLKVSAREVEVRVGYTDTLWGEWPLHKAELAHPGLGAANGTFGSASKLVT